MKGGKPISFLIAVVLCGLPALITSLAGCLAAGFGLMADPAQLMLDTGLDRSTLLWGGLGTLCCSISPVLLLAWIGLRHQNSKEK